MLNETVLAAMFLALTGGQPAAAADAPQQPQAAARKAPAQDVIYGSQLMTAEERDAYRTKMRAAKTQAERDQVRAEHHAQMQQRAKERGVTLPAQPVPGGGRRGPR
jgi:hypothetical protein